MKTLNQILIIVLAVSLGCLNSCSKSDDEGGDQEAPSGILIANVDGTSYKSFEISSSATISSVSTGKNLVIIATNSDGNAFMMTVFGYTGEGTYEFTGENTAITNVASYTETDVNLSNPTASTTEIWHAPYDDTSVGFITISEETDSKVIGTFNFKCKNVNGDGSFKNITNGAFNLKKN